MNLGMKDVIYATFMIILFILELIPVKRRVMQSNVIFHCPLKYPFLNMASEDK